MLTDRLLHKVLLVCSTSLSSCGTPTEPLDLNVCIINGVTGRLDCATKDTNSHIEFKSADEYICLAPGDFQSLVQDLKRSE